MIHRPNQHIRLLCRFQNRLFPAVGEGVPRRHEDRLFQLQPGERVVVRHPDGGHELPDPHRRQPPHAQRHVRRHAGIRPQAAGTVQCVSGHLQSLAKVSSSSIFWLLFS